MARFGETLFRFAGALLLAGAATVIDGQAHFPKKGKRKPKPTTSLQVEAQPVPITISRGMRAYGIRLADDARVIDVVKPNDRVDVVAVVGNQTDDMVAKLFMTDVRLLAVRAVPMRGEGSVVVASLEVTPNAAEALAIASRQAALHLVQHGSWDPTNPGAAAALGAGPSCPTTGPAERLVVPSCPPRNPPPEFVAPRR